MNTMEWVPLGETEALGTPHTLAVTVLIVEEVDLGELGVLIKLTPVIAFGEA